MAVDKTALIDAITAASVDQENTAISADGSDVEKADKWVPQSAADAMKEAVEAAKAVMDNMDATQDEVDAAADALKQAQKAFDEAKKDGIKADDHDASCPSKAFSDLDTSKWYHEAIDYVLLKNYFNGVGDGKFDPEQNISREQLITIIYRMAEKKGLVDETGAENSLNSFVDCFAVHCFC